MPDVGDVTVENQIIDANGNVIGILEEKSSVKTNETLGVAYTTTPLEGYRLVKDGKTYEYVKVADNSAPTNGEVKTDPQHVIYQYREVKGGEVVEKHVIEGTDTELVAADGTTTATTVKEAGTPLDEAFSTQPKAALLYDAQGNAYKSNGDTDGKDNNAIGKVTAAKQTVTFEYVPVKGSVTVNYVDEDGNQILGVDPKTVKDNEPVTKDGNKYDTTTEDFRPKKVTATDGTEYELVAETPKDGSADTTGTVEEGTKNVTYVYRKVVKTGSVVARCVIEVTETEIADDKSVKPTDTPVDEPYGDTPPATITKDGKTYTLVRTRTNDGDAPSNGTVVEDEQTITYEYKEVVDTPDPVEKKTGSVLVRHITDKGEVLADTTDGVRDGEVGSTYETTVGNFEGYTFAKVDETGATPTGEVEEGEKTVVYIYTKVEMPVAKTGSVLVRHITDKGEVLADTTDVVRDGEVGSTYETSVGNFEGYTFVKVDETGVTPTGEVEEGEKTVVYIYTKVETPVAKTGSVVARYVIEGTETEIADDKSVKPADTPVDEPYGDTPPATIIVN